jgi:23S rRNA (cytosine1962-C5)-methyltransferase
MAISGFTTDQYELLDFGAGRKLERFGDWILDREAPAADAQQRSDPALWKNANLVFKRG